MVRHALIANELVDVDLHWDVWAFMEGLIGHGAESIVCCVRNLFGNETPAKATAKIALLSATSADSCVVALPLPLFRSRPQLLRFRDACPVLVSTDRRPWHAPGDLT